MEELIFGLKLIFIVFGNVKKSVKLDIVMLKVCADLVCTPISHCTNS